FRLSAAMSTATSKSQISLMLFGLVTARTLPLAESAQCPNQKRPLPTKVHSFLCAPTSCTTRVLLSSSADTNTRNLPSASARAVTRFGPSRTWHGSPLAVSQTATDPSPAVAANRPSAVKAMHRELDL